MMTTHARRKMARLITFATLATSAVAGSIAHAEDHPSPGTLMCVGDSVTHAAGAVAGKGYVELLRARAVDEHVALTIVKDGRSGWTTGGFAKAVDAPGKVPIDTTMITIMLGMNDSHSTQPAGPIADHAVANIDALVAAYHARAPHASITLLSPTAIDVAKLTPPLLKAHYGENSVTILKALTDAYRTEAAKKGWRFVDLSTLPSAGHTSDGVHPDLEGHAELAKAIWAGLSTPPPPATQPAVPEASRP